MTTPPTTSATTATAPAAMRPMARPESGASVGAAGTRIEGCAVVTELAAVPLLAIPALLSDVDRLPSASAAAMAAATSEAACPDPAGTTTTAPTVTPAAESARARRSDAGLSPTCSTTTLSSSQPSPAASHSACAKASSSRSSASMSPSMPRSITTSGSDGSDPASAHSFEPAGHDWLPGKYGSHTVSARWHGPAVPGQQPAHWPPGPDGGKPPGCPVAHLVDPAGQTPPYSNAMQVPSLLWRHGPSVPPQQFGHTPDGPSSTSTSSPSGGAISPSPVWHW
mmetsp:Transcript_17115/g.60059  ORF Transcript_17115/g.60059 Transcript_17115/m.60059 type:complete len:281 (-) Transcript_17115:1338-2180(-)